MAAYCDDPVEFEAGTPKKKFSSLLAFVLFAVAGTFFVQNTLAANISLNTGAPIEFGQGITQTPACSGATNLTIIPFATFTNVAGAGSFKFSSVTVSGIPSSCNGSDFTINAYDNSSDTPLALFNTTSTSAVIYNNTGTFQVGTGGTGMTVASSTGTFTATFTAPVALSSSIFKITIQSGAHAPIVYTVGSTGPGGGTIFYVATSPFACGPTRAGTCTYLEAAPSGWNVGADPELRWAITTYQSTPVGYSAGDTATATAIGWGYRNTRAIILQGNTDTATIAAALADSHIVTVSGVDYDDWYLPSKDELAKLYSQKTLIGGFAGADYWSSSEHNAGNAKLEYFPDGYQGYDGKQYFHFVRPVRAF